MGYFPIELEFHVKKLRAPNHIIEMTVFNERWNMEVQLTQESSLEGLCVVSICRTPNQSILRFRLILHHLPSSHPAPKQKRRCALSAIFACSRYPYVCHDMHQIKQYTISIANWGREYWTAMMAEVLTWSWRYQICNDQQLPCPWHRGSQGGHIAEDRNHQ